MKENILDFLANICRIVLSKNQDSEKKSAYKPVNSNFSAAKANKEGRIFAENYISPKKSAVEMLRRHDTLSKKIDSDNKR